MRRQELPNNNDDDKKTHTTNNYNTNYQTDRQTAMQ